MVRARIIVFLVAVAAFLSTPLQAAESQVKQLSQADRENYKNAFLHLKKKRYRDARIFSGRATDKRLAKVVRWLILTDPNANVSYQETRAFLEQNPDWPRQQTLQRSVERTMPWGLPDAQILAWYDARPPVTVAGAMKHINALQRSGRKQQAQALIRETWREGNFDRAQEKAFRSLYRKVLTHEDNLARLDRLLWRRSVSASRRQAKRMGKGYPQLAEARLALAARKPGVDYALGRVPARLRSDPGLLYERTRWRQRKERYDGVVELLDPPKPERARPERWWKLRNWLVRQALDRGHYERAYRIAKDHGLDGGVAYAEAEWLAGWTALRFLKRPKEAYRHFTNLYYRSSSPISRGRGAFWAGEAARAFGNQPWAELWYEAAAEHATTFYGQLAANRVGRRVQISFATPATASSERRQGFDQSELVQIVRLLGEVQQRGAQKTFLLGLRDRAETAEDFALAAELAMAVHRPDFAIRIAKDARFKGVLLTDRLFPAPTKYKAARLEQALLLAVIRQESAFDRKAVSGASAQGLMQLMPATAKAVAKRLRLKYSRSRLTSDPNYNLRLGSAYLGQLLKQYNGSQVLALAAYNAGPPRVSRWIKKYGDPRTHGIDPIDWIEQIPFNETRNYVQRVIESLVVYRERLGTSGSRMKLPLDPATAALGVPAQ